MIEKLDETKQNFETQLKEANERISNLKLELEKLEEYKLKLQGGLETIDLLRSNNTEESSEEK